MGKDRMSFFSKTAKTDGSDLFPDDCPPFSPDPEDEPIAPEPDSQKGPGLEVAEVVVVKCENVLDGDAAAQIPEDPDNEESPVAEAEAIAETESPLILAEANALVIRTGDDQKAAHALRQRIKEAEDRIDEKLRPIADGAYANWKATLRLIDEVKAHFTPVRNIIEDKITKFRVEAERRAREEKERLRREHEEKVRAEQRRQAEIMKAEAEERAKTAATQREKDRITKEAEERAKEAVAGPISIPEFEVKNEGKLAGVSSRKNWSFEIVSEDQIPRKFMTPDLKKLGVEARNMEEKAEVPGVRFFYTEKSAFRK